MSQQSTLAQQIRDQRFEHRLEQASLIARAEQGVERDKAALAIVQEIALHQVFSQLTPDQLATLGDKFVTLVAEHDRKRIPSMLVEHIRPTDATGQKHLFRG